MRAMNWLTLVVLVFALATTAGAQSKFAGKCSQGKANPEYSVTTGDKTLVLAKTICTWSAGDLGGDQLKAEEDIYTSDMMGKTSRDHGYGAGTTASGDKYFIKFDGTTTFEKNNPVSGTCTWAFTGGTGKLKGLKGKGTCTGKFDSSGAAVFDIVGEYQLAAAKK